MCMFAQSHNVRYVSMATIFCQRSHSTKYITGMFIITYIQGTVQNNIATTTIYKVFCQKALTVFKVFMVVRVELMDFKDTTSCMFY
jgi:hypothetical protein